MYSIKIHNSAKKDISKLKIAKLELNFEKVFNQLKTDPFADNQKFEKLTPPGNGKYSRRINYYHRVVYKVDKKDKIVYILSAYGHY